MKKINIQTVKSAIFRLLVFSALFLTQCNDDIKNDDYAIATKIPSGFIKITGYINNRDFYPDTKDINMIIPSISGENRVSQIETPINDDGTFYYEFYLPRSQEVRMEPYLEFLFLIPGDSLHIEIDFKNLLDIRFSGGKSAEINREFQIFFIATAYRTTEFNYKGVGTDCEMNCSWDQIRKKIDEERNFYRDRRQAFLKKNKVSEEVAFLTEAMIELDYYRRILRAWLNRRNFFFKEVMDIETLMNELDEVAVKYFNSGLYSDAHFKFITPYMIVAREYNQQRLGNDIDFVDWTKEVAKTEAIRDFMLTVQAGKALLQKDMDDFERISLHVNQEYLLDRLMQEYKVTREKMINPENISSYILGVPSENFTNDILQGNENILSKIITPNYGKVQVIHIGMGSCGFSEAEQLAKLNKEYAGKKDMHVSYINISRGSKEVRELYRSAGIDDTSVHFPTDEEYLFLNKTLSLLSFPHSILVNKKGVIVDNGPNVRTEYNLKEKIELLLEQDKLIK